MRKVKWGVLGTASILSASAPGMQKAEHCELYAIAGRDAQKTETFRERYGFQKAYTDYEELLNDDAVEAVYIPLPNHMHCEWTIRALQHGKHVLCEKPLAPSAEIAQKMFDAARENGVVLMEAFAYQHSPYMAALCEEVQKGIIGDIRFIDTDFLGSDYNEDNYRLHKEFYGGALYDLGVYNISFILRLLGKEPEEVQAVASFSEEKVDMLTDAMMLFENGVRTSFSCGMVLATGKGQRFDTFEIHGTKGVIRPWNFQYNASGDLKYEIALFDGTNEVKILHVPDNYALEMEQLSMCALGQEKPFVTEEFSMMTARTVDRLLEKIGY